MKPFLRQVAETYVEHEGSQMIDYCFVFPNKRSARFFQHFLSEALPPSSVYPAITNISDFVGEFSDKIEANRYEQLFTLYDEYRQLPGIDIDFEKFLYWGEMLAGDFNDVDRYLVDADALFVNVRRLREISANYLTPSQIEIIRRYWGEDRTRMTVDRFWNHLEKNPDTPQHQHFLKLWEVLAPLYHAFHRRLEEQGLASSGMLYRNAAERLDSDEDLRLPYSRVIFVGFNVLSTSEIKIFSTLQKLGLADFYWDFNSLPMNDADSRAGRFMRRNIKEFPSMYPIEEPLPEMPKIDIIGVPSNVGQVKTAGQVIEEWVGDKTIANPDNAINTAVVLPDESLLIPMIHSVPKSIRKLNVTMGFPMRLSPIASVISEIVSLHLRSRVDTAGNPFYFWEDVKAILNTSSIRNVCPDDCKKLESLIQEKKMFSVPVRTILEICPELKVIFEPFDADRHEAAFRYLSDLCKFLASTISPDDKIQQRFLESYQQALEQLDKVIGRYKIRMTAQSFIRMIERALNSDSVNFVGEPLQGLQIMGVLETRALDFDNIILLSMNERVFPRRHYTRSFIPDALRHGYGMSTIDFQESIYAYYFYRLISRARNVTLIYDARTIGSTKSSERSRYLNQLLYFYKTPSTTHRLMVYDPSRFESEKIVIQKNERIMKLLDAFKAGGRKNLSASSINKYIQCPLRFYLQYAEGYSEDNEIVEYIDSGKYGTIVHAVAQMIYQNFQGFDPLSAPKPSVELPPVTVTRDMLQHLIMPQNPTLDRFITAAINRLHNCLPLKDQLSPLVGESLIQGKVIRHNIVDMLRNDIELTPFKFISAEEEMTGQLQINDSLSINIKQIIDRVDCVKLEEDGRTVERKRFVDYKTGKDETRVSYDSMFTRGSNSKAEMQLMFYCHVNRCLNGDDSPIMPVIYKMESMASQPITPIYIDKKPLLDYRTIYDRYKEDLNAVVSEIFDPEVPFTQCEESKSCSYCPFKAICGRE